MANTFGKQTLVAKEAFFQFSQTGKISQNIDWRSDDFSPSENIGGAKTYRRPARVETSSRGVLTDGSVPVGAQTLTSFTEPLVTLTVGRAFEANLGISLDDATFALSKEQVVSRHLAPAARKLRNQIDTYIGNLALLYSGNVVGNPASPSTGTAARDAFERSRRDGRDLPGWWSLPNGTGEHAKECRGHVVGEGRSPVLLSLRGHVAPMVAVRVSGVLLAFGVDRIPQGPAHRLHFLEVGQLQFAVRDLFGLVLRVLVVHFYPHPFDMERRTGCADFFRSSSPLITGSKA